MLKRRKSGPMCDWIQVSKTYRRLPTADVPNGSLPARMAFDEDRGMTIRPVQCHSVIVSDPSCAPPSRRSPSIDRSGPASSRRPLLNGEAVAKLAWIYGSTAKVCHQRVKIPQFVAQKSGTFCGSRGHRCRGDSEVSVKVLGSHLRAKNSLNHLKVN